MTDDIHPDDLLGGHLNLILKKAVKIGLDPILAIRMVTINPAVYFGLKTLGAVAPGYQADMVLLDDLHEFQPIQVYKKGDLVVERGKPVREWARENFPVMTGMNVRLPDKPFEIKARKEKMKVIEVIPGQIVTRKVIAEPKRNKRVGSFRYTKGYSEGRSCRTTYRFGQCRPWICARVRPV